MIYFLLIVSFFISLFLTFLFWKLGKKFKIYDLASKDPLKIHQKSISCLGGLAMILTISITFFLKMTLEKNFDWQILGIIIGGFLIFSLGFLDDLRWRDKSKIKPWKKFIFLVLFSFLAAAILLKLGLNLQFLPILIIEAILAFLYIFFFINAMNYEDGIDGLAGGLAVISLIGFIGLSIILDNSLALIISLISITAILGFLVFNFPPAKIFMGDSGAYFLGFILAVLLITFSKPYDIFSIVGPAFIVGMPIFEGVSTNIRRLINKKSIFLGDRSHFFDKILQKGISIKKTLLVCYSLQIISVAVGLLISNL